MSTPSVVFKDTTNDRHSLPSDGPDAAHTRLRHAIDHAAHLLPAQGPITVFIHHNTLHAFEDRSFEEAVEEGAQVFGCQPYLRRNDTARHSARGGFGSPTCGTCFKTISATVPTSPLRIWYRASTCD